jgi:acyl-CoA synthetase (NDP forming)
MTAPADVVLEFERAGFPVFEDTDRALTAIAALSFFSEHFARGLVAPAMTYHGLPALPSDEMNEHKAKQALADAGISIWPERAATDAAQAGSVALNFGCDVAIKILSADILHKSDAGGVALRVPGKDAERVASEMLDRVASQHPDARIEGFLISPMCEGGVETICGSIRDSVFGPVVMFGLGGIFVEVLGDVTFRLAPIDHAEAMSMINEVRGRKILDGVRGAPAVDVDALAQVLVRLSQFASHHRHAIAEVEINPLRVMPSGAVALDALITRG